MHPADSSSWKPLNTIHPNFGLDPRNVRLGLASDGFNLFGLMSLSHNTWPVVMPFYNLPRTVAMHESTLFISLIAYSWSKKSWTRHRCVLRTFSR